ncbi:hypothetical protein Q7P37_002562 [Cladosporium fusiforme]
MATIDNEQWPPTVLLYGIHAKTLVQVRWHFKNFIAVEPPEMGERENDRGETGYFKVEEGEPAFVPNNPHRLIYGWRNGGPVAERTNFSHVWINTREMEDFDLSGDGWMDETITSLRRHVVHTAVGIVHELTHASLYIFSQYREPFCNQESVLEPGFAMENYVFGGHLERHKDGKVYICPWPNHEMGKLFPQRTSEAPLPSHDKHVLEKDDWEPLLQDEFWDETENRRGLREPRLKKLWLRKQGSHIKWSDWYSEKFRPADQPRKRRKVEEEGEDE